MVTPAEELAFAIADIFYGSGESMTKNYDALRQLIKEDEWYTVHCGYTYRARKAFVDAFITACQEKGFPAWLLYRNIERVISDDKSEPLQ